MRYYTTRTVLEAKQEVNEDSAGKYHLIEDSVTESCRVGRL